MLNKPRWWSEHTPQTTLDKTDFKFVVFYFLVSLWLGVRAPLTWAYRNLNLLDPQHVQKSKRSRIGEGRKVYSICRASVKVTQTENHTTATHPGLRWWNKQRHSGQDCFTFLNVDTVLNKQTQKIIRWIWCHQWILSQALHYFLHTGLQRDVVGWNELTISIMLTFYLSFHGRGVFISHIITWNVEKTRIMGDEISWHMSCIAR